MLPWRLQPASPCASPPEFEFEFEHLRSPGEKQFLAVVLLIAVIELPLVHVLLGHFSGVAAWVATGLTLVGVLWVVAVFRAADIERCFVCGEVLHVNDGVFTQYSVSRAAVRSLEVKELRQGPSSAPGGYEVVLELAEPVVVRGLATPESRTSVSVEVADATVIEELSLWVGVGVAGGIGVLVGDAEQQGHRATLT